MKINNLVAKHSPHRGGKHKDRKRASRQVRGHKRKESDSEKYQRDELLREAEALD